MNTRAGILDYAPAPTKRWARFLRRSRWSFLTITLGMLLGACLGWAVSPATRFVATAIFRAEAPFLPGHGWPEDQKRHDAAQRKLLPATLSTLRAPDLAAIALQQRGPCANSLIQTPAQLRDCLNIRQIDGTRLITITITDESPSGAQQNLGAFLAVARERIDEYGLADVFLIVSGPDIRLLNHHSLFAGAGAAFGGIAAIVVLLMCRRARAASSKTSAHPLQPMGSL